MPNQNVANLLQYLSQPRLWWKPVLGVFVLFYMVFHTLHGELGLYALMKEEQRQVVLKEELTQVMGELASVENRIQRFQTGSVDMDLLDEQLRRHMGIAPAGEYLVLSEES